MITSALIESLTKQAELFREMEADSKSEIPPETISKAEYYHDLQAHIRAIIRDLKTLTNGQK